MALDLLRQKLASLLGGQPTSNNSSSPATPFPRINPSSFPTPSLTTSNSTPSMIAPGEGTIGQAKKLLGILNPMQPITQRPLFAKAGQESTLPFGGPIVGTALNLASRTIESIPAIALTTIANFRAYNAKDTSVGVKVPFDVSRLGITDKPGQTFIQNTGEKMVAHFDELEKANPGRTKTNIALASLTPVTDALDAFVAGDLFSSVARAGLKATQYTPELEKALQQYGLKGVDGANLKDEFVSRFNKKARKLVLADDQAGLDQLGQATNTILTHMTGTGIPKLNSFGQLVQDVSRVALQDVKGGLKLKNPMFAELAPDVVPQGLPGTAEVPGQGLPVGLSTRRVVRVGGENNAPGKYFQSKAGTFEPVEEKNALPVNLGENLDTFVVKNPEGYSVVEGQSGMKLGQTAKTSAEAIDSAKAELDSMAPGALEKMVEAGPLSPRYQLDTSKPNTTPATPENAAAQYYDGKISKELAAGEPFVIGGDDLKDYFGKDFNDKNHPIYSKAAFQLYEKALKETPGNTVAFTGGGAGAGKTEMFVKQLRKPGALDGIVYDSNMSIKDGVKKQIQMARDAGKNVKVYGILPDLETARMHTILRQNAGGHGISDKTFAKGHAGFPQVIQALLEDGTIKPSELHLFDTRGITDYKEAFKKVALGIEEKDPIATLKKLRYNETDLNTKYAKENFDQKTGQRIQKPGFREKPRAPSPLDRTNKGNANGSGNGSLLEGNKSEVDRVDQLIRKLEGQKRALASARANPEMHAKAYGSDKIAEYKKNIRKLTKQIEEDAPVLKDTKAKTASAATPLEVRINEFQTERNILEEAVNNNPAKELAKFANKNGELPEVIGEGGMFGKSGDTMITELGFKDSEEARAAYQDYRLQKRRLSVVKENVKILKETFHELRLQDADEKRLKRFLNKKAAQTEKDVANIAKGEKDPETKAELDARKAAATARQNLLMKALATREPAIEGQTLQSQLEQIQNSQPISQADHEKLSEDFSFNKTLIDTSTPVKSKVNILDYLRTPDRVLKKIGLEKTADDVRKAYEAYLAELPVHIEQITEWSKRVSPEANKRIFQYLDGQQHRTHFSGKVHTKITGEELKVANEIRDYLKEWADRLGLPNDNKITHYITHIFNVGEVEKEFDEDVAKLIKDKVPGSVYDPFLEKRLGRKGYIEDTWASLDAYVKRAVRKANMDPVLEKLKNAAEKMEDSQATYIKRFANLVNMRPTEVDTLLDNLIKSVAGYRFGQRPVAMISRKLRQVVYRSMLGLNVTSAIRNLTQGVNTFAELGTRSTLKGYMDLVTRARSSELEDVGILRQDFIQDRTLSSTRKKLEKIDKGLFILFDLAERINRGAAYYGAKDKALRMGASEYNAVQYAKKVVRDTQFQFGSIDTPVALNNDLMKLATQFMSFGFKQTEFAAEKFMKKDFAGIIRYIIGALLLTYGAGQVFNIKGKDFIPGYSFLKFGAPPALALPISIFKAVVDAPGYFGQKMSYSAKAMDIFSNIPFPASLQIQKTYKALTADSKQKPAGSGKSSTTSALKRLNRLKSITKPHPALSSLSRLKKLHMKK